ncbi:MAG: ABC transporter ATP-binding protein [Candidatus Dormibacteria bacterium]
MEESLIDVRGLTKVYSGKPAVSDLTFSVRRGEVVGFLGPNGAGKTTTMRMLTGYISASGGSASIAGEDIFSRSVQARRHIGYLPETVPLYTDLSVRDYLAFMARIRGVPSSRRRARLEEVVAATGLTEYVDRPISQLSRGFRQRVGLAQAIIHDPDVIILDEPTVGLDPIQVREMRQLIRELGDQHTVLLSSHILSEVSMLCNRVLVIHEGQLRANDTPEALERSLEKGGARITLEVGGPDEAVSGALSRVEGVTEVTVSTHRDGHGVFQVQTGDTDIRHQIAASVINGGWQLYELRAETLSLEEIFVKLTGSDPDGAAVDQAETGDAPEEAAATESEETEIEPEGEAAPQEED